MGLKELILNKGWAGTTFSRRLNPLIRRQYELNHSYDFIIRNVSSPEIAREMELIQKTARVDIGKMSETVLSAGGVPYNGIDLEPDRFDLGSSDNEMFNRIREVESDFEAALAAEVGENHQIRTKAILQLVLGNSRSRSEFLRAVMRQRQSRDNH
jgi:hypothetical protein